MRTSKIARSTVFGVPLLIIMMLVLSVPMGASAAKTPRPKPPRVLTGPALHVQGSGALLTGSVLPNGSETTYYFQYGPTTAYGSQTPSASAGAGITKVPVGQAVAGLTPGLTYHYRIVAVAANGRTAQGHERTFVAGKQGSRILFRLESARLTDVYGSPLVISGALQGTGAGNHAIALQASPFPYLESFVTLGSPGATNASGAFSFRVSNLATSTQFRVITLDRLPVYSATVAVQVALHVILHVGRTSRPGFERFYGTVAPAQPGARIYFQYQQAARPHGKSESTVKLVTASSTVLKPGSSGMSKFSAVVEIRRAARYKAFVKLGRGPLTSGASQSYVIRTIVPATKHKSKKKG